MTKTAANHTQDTATDRYEVLQLFLADRTNGRTDALMLQYCVCCVSTSVTLIICG